MNNTKIKLYLLALHIILPAILQLSVLKAKTGSDDTPTNSITITELENVTSNNYPVQFGRPFLKGEVTDFPQALIDGNAVETQANVKNRYEDGSVKYAILSFLIPTLEANSSKTITFQNQANGNNTALTKYEMLDASFDFEATMELTNVSTVSASARQMLQNDDFTYWLQGEIATSVILADHSNQLTSGGHSVSEYDIGFDENKSFRPVFHATFWPDINKVTVRFIGEISNTESLQDIVLTNLVLKTGEAAPAIKYELPAANSPLKMYLGSRWTKKYWINGKPSDIKINHNTEYLIATKYLLNYDLSKTINQDIVNTLYDEWVANNELYEKGNWTGYMPQTGQRIDIGPYPTTTSNWFYSWTKKTRDIAFGQADLAAAWPMNYREGSLERNGAPRYFDRQETTIATGKPISVIGRQTLMTHPSHINSSGVGTQDVDKLNIVGNWAKNPYSNAPPDEHLPWYPDAAHAPDPFSIQYLLSGDYFYLEQMYFWASFHSFYYNPVNERGPEGSYGGIYGQQIRGAAWIFRSRVRTAALSPDGSPEKQLFTDLTNDTIALWEGQRGITGTIHENSSMWNWGNTTPRLFTPSPLFHWNEGSEAHVQDFIDPSKTSRAHSPWEYSFLHFAFGQAKELGFDIDGIRTWFAQNLIQQIVNSDYDPYLVGATRIPVKDINGEYFQNWATTKEAYLGSMNAENEFRNTLTWGPGNSYPHFALGATAMVADQPGGKEAWEWISPIVQPYTDGSPKWALLPRNIAEPLHSQSADIEKNSFFTIHPNPTKTNKFSLSVHEKEAGLLQIELYSLTGKLLINKKVPAQETIKLSIPWLTRGVYIIKVSVNKKSRTQKLIFSD